MSVILNPHTMLSVIGTLQPASPGEIVRYLHLLFDDAGTLPSEAAVQSFCLSQANEGRLVRVARSPDLFSLSLHGSLYLNKRHRLIRDKRRMYLLKDARRGRIAASRGVTAPGLGGDAPPADERPLVKGSEANKFGLCVPRGQTYWPRFSRQLIEETGPSRSLRDTEFPLLSFADEKQLALACRTDVAELDLDYTTIGAMLGVSPRLVLNIARQPEKHYRTFQLRKKGGGTRTIESPRTFLKVIQHFLLDYYLSSLPTDSHVFSYRPEMSVIDNAAPHIRKEYVANIDIENFFGSIRQERVIALLMGNGYSELASILISRFCCKDGILPQGAPTSPAISNSFLQAFDREFSQECEAVGLAYSRYADDISISGDNLNAIKGAIDVAAKMLAVDYGLRLNAGKTRIASKHGQQKVTGVVVNDAPRPPRKLRREIRAAFHNAAKRRDTSPDTISYLSGYLSYLRIFKALEGSVHLKSYRRILGKLRALAKEPANGDTALY